MRTSTQTASDLGLAISNLIGSKRYNYYVGGRGYDRSLAMQEAEEQLLKEEDDNHILINMTTQAIRESHPRSDFGDYTVIITGDLFKIEKNENVST